jgi:hypothetical protein
MFHSGLATMCVGVGQGIAVLVERVDTRKETRPSASHSDFRSDGIRGT